MIFIVALIMSNGGGGRWRRSAFYKYSCSVNESVYRKVNLDIFRGKIAAYRSPYNWKGSISMMEISTTAFTSTLWAPLQTVARLRDLTTIPS